MTIVIDSREKERCRNLWKKYLLEFGNLDAIITSLGDIRTGGAGDILITSESPDSIGIERKMLSDFVNSWKEGRLFSQLALLKARYTYPILLLEYDVMEYDGLLDKLLRLHGRDELVSLGMKMSSFTKTLFRIQTEGIFILHSQNLEQTALIMLHLHQYLNSTKVHHAMLPRKSALSPRDKKVNILMLIESIGQPIAEAIMEHFQWNLFSVATATPSQIREVPGVGYDKSIKIVQFFRSGDQ